MKKQKKQNNRIFRNICRGNNTRRGVIMARYCPSLISLKMPPVYVIKSVNLLLLESLY